MQGASVLRLVVANQAKIQQSLRSFIHFQRHLAPKMDGTVEYCPGAEKISAQGTGASIASSAPIHDIQVWLQCGFMRPLTMSHCPGGRRGKMREVLPCDFSMVMY